MHSLNWERQISNGVYNKKKPPPTLKKQPIKVSSISFVELQDLICGFDFEHSNTAYNDLTNLKENIS